MKEELKLIHRGSDELINEKELVEKLKEEQVTGHVTLLKGERSKVATIAATKL